jgi:hypothetical protein
VRSLDPTLGLARIGTDDVDVQSVQCAPKLGHAVAAQRARLVDTKHPTLVAVKCHRLAPGFEGSAGRVEISEGRLAFDKLEVHQPTRRVIDEYQQRTLRPAILRPPVLAAVNLDQLADTIAPVARLMDTLSPPLAIAPQPGFDHPKPQCLPTERYPMNLAQLLGRQSWAKIPVPLADHREHCPPQRLGFTPVAVAAASLRD